VTDSCWPAGYTATAFFSYDIDGEAWLLGDDPRNAGLPVTLSQARYGPTVGAFEILRILERLDVRATFFVPSAVAEKFPDTVRAVSAGGHEVALHGHLHERPNRLTEAQEREVTERSIEILERLSGTRPVGYRAPGAEVSPHTIAILAEHGVRYTSQHMDDVFPYLHPEGLLELPIHWTLDDWSYSMISPYAFPAGQENPVRTSREILEIWSDELDAIATMGGLFTLVNHPQVSGRPGRLKTVEGIIRHAQANPAIWIANGRQIDAHWRSSGAVAPAPAERGRLRAHA
jgi:peptidoglycan/xylan/chitin deacetylase (PgdA/CDA1 family)